MEMISALISLLLQWYVWIPIVAVLSFLTWRNYQQADRNRGVEGVLLTLEIPRTNGASEEAAEKLFTSLHGIVRDAKELRLSSGQQEHISLELASFNGQIRFYVWTPKTLQSFIEGQIYAQYPDVQIYPADGDYVDGEREHQVAYSAELTLTDHEFLPLRTFQESKTDPLTSITKTLAELELSGEELWIQLVVRPVPNDWQEFAERWSAAIGKKMGISWSSIGGGMQWLGGLLEVLWRPPEQGIGKKTQAELSEIDKLRVDKVMQKAAKPGFQVKLRLVCLSDNQTNAKVRLQALAGAFQQFTEPHLNGLKLVHTNYGREYLTKYRKRTFVDDGFILNTEELAALYHLPHTQGETPNVVWASSKTAEPPAKLPVITGNTASDAQISAFGVTDFRGINHQFGMLRFDRSRHVYIIGQTGTGKSGLLELMTLSDVFHNQGYAIIDPHGDFAINNMKFIPGSRLQDVVYFNPADTAYPLGFNPLEVTDPNRKTNISSEVIGVLKRMFGESWGPRLEYILRYTILALLDRPETTLLDVTRMLTDRAFRHETLQYCTDTVVLQFWNVEFASWNDKFVTEAISPVLNKIGAFTANPIIRNIIGQPRSTFNIRQMMDEGKILIVNLSKGLIGEDNAAILGSFLVTKIQLAAMSRSDIPDIRDRRPFYLYVDEFQNFATDSFATIMSEARKYGLNLTVANQYISQMSDTVRDAVFGNVGSMICFRVSADDAPVLAKQFEPNFEAIDLLQMHNRQFVINMVIGGEKTPAFSAQTLELPPAQTDNTALIIDYTRRHYTRDRQLVEQDIAAMMQPPAPKSAPQPPITQPVQPQHATALEAAPAPTQSDQKNDEQSRKKRTRTRRRKIPTAAKTPEKQTNDTTPQRAATLTQNSTTDISFKIEH